jgi:hypothetical protein
VNVLAFCGVALVCLPLVSLACIWDADTVRDEQKKDPSLAAAILTPSIEEIDFASLTARIQRLRAAPSTNDPNWWNDLAGAYLRLGEATNAVALLEPITNRFADNYGIHANLGTAYHLLGRYVEAEREISRDLDINPDGHFGLEKYHLALLQYLMRDSHYQFRHVFVDEFTVSFLLDGGFRATASTNLLDYLNGQSTNLPSITSDEIQKLWDDQSNTKKEFYDAVKKTSDLAEADLPASYRIKWNLGADPNLEKGVVYMSSLNRQQPACWVMLGVLAAGRSDKNLTISAFEKAIQLGSPQKSILQADISALRKHIAEARNNRVPVGFLGFVLVIVVGSILFFFYLAAKFVGGRM